MFKVLFLRFHWHIKLENEKQNINMHNMYVFANKKKNEIEHKHNMHTP